MEFMSGGGNIMNIRCRQVHGIVPYRLYAVGMEDGIILSTQLFDYWQIQQATNLIIGVHKGNQALSCALRDLQASLHSSVHKKTARRRFLIG